MARLNPEDNMPLEMGLLSKQIEVLKRRLRAGTLA